MGRGILFSLRYSVQNEDQSAMLAAQFYPQCSGGKISLHNEREQADADTYHID